MEKEVSIIYNCLVDGQYGSVIKEIYSGKTVKEIKTIVFNKQEWKMGALA